MFKLNSKMSLGETVRGLFKTPIQWEDRLKGRKWIDYSGLYEPQKWSNHDSESCWVLGGCVSSIEDQMELMYADNQFSQEAKDFFHNNNYIDEAGDFSISERFIEILGGRKDSGGTSEMAWQLVQKYGILPRKLLTYSVEEANTHYSQESFVADYFNPKAVTPAMLALALQSKKYLNIAYQFIGKKWTTPSNEILTAAIQTAPVCVGIPVTTPTMNWNVPYVKYDSTTALAHEVELHFIESDGTRDVSDQYLPDEKRLSPNYPLYVCTQGILYSLSKPPQAPSSPVPTPEQTFIQRLWSAIYHYWSGIPDSFTLG